MCFAHDLRRYLSQMRIPMTDAATLTSAEKTLTLQWKTMGLEDRDLEEAKTLTLRPNGLGAQTSAELVDQLPRLLHESDRDTLPELRVKGLLGEGGMGRVELAEQLSLGRDVALKKVREDAQSEHSTLVLLREGWTTGLLEHPNIIPIYTLGRDDDDEPVIVMKKIEGTSWMEIIDDPDCAPGTFEADDPVELHVEILIQVCNAIEFAHSRGIIHRDLKPENVMLGEFGEVYVLDWGIAVSVEDDPTGRLVCADEVDSPAGTPCYMAPEMTEGDGSALGPHTDVFLLGAMLYEALTGRPPYDGPTLFSVMLRANKCPSPTFDEDVPEDLAAICRRAMARDPQERFADVRSLRSALHDFRRRREASRLSDQGDARLEEVLQLLTREKEDKPIDDATLYGVFGQCRFAYEQSLKIDAHHRGAQDGLQRVLEAMADRALRRNAFKAASLLISDFPAPNPEYQRRLEALEDDLESRQREFEHLQKIRRDVDTEVGRSSRAYFILVMGILWTVLSFGLAIATEKGVIEVTPKRMFFHIVGLTALVGAVAYLGRERFFTNELNRRMIWCVIAAFGFVTAHRGIVWIRDIDYHSSFAFEMVTYSMAIFLLAIAFDRRLLIPALPFLFLSYPAAIWPEKLYWFFSVANTLTVILILWMWWPKDDPCAVTGGGSKSDSTR